MDHTITKQNETNKKYPFKKNYFNQLYYKMDSILSTIFFCSKQVSNITHFFGKIVFHINKSLYSVRNIQFLEIYIQQNITISTYYINLKK